MKNCFAGFPLLMATCCLILSIDGFAQKKKDDVPPASAADPIASKVSGLKHFPGYIPFWYDEKKDKVGRLGHAHQPSWARCSQEHLAVDDQLVAARAAASQLL